MVDLPGSLSSQATSAAIPTTTNRAYELMKHGGGPDSRHEYELVSAPSSASSPASNPLEVMYEIPSPAIPAAKKEEEGVYDSIPGDQ